MGQPAILVPVSLATAYLVAIAIYPLIRRRDALCIIAVGLACIAVLACLFIIPREHVPSLNQATDAAMLGRLSLMAADIARTEGVAEAGYRTVINTNAAAGQTVFHVHLHLLGGRSMHWPPG